MSVVPGGGNGAGVGVLKSDAGATMSGGQNYGS
jgi:hypothetical protein